MEPDKQLIALQPVDVNRAVDGHVLNAADAFHREPELLDLARLVGRNPRIVRLIVAPAADHQLKIRSVIVGEDFVPDVRLREVAPKKELLADGDVAVRDVGRSHLLSMIVSGEPGVVGIHREDGTRLDGEVLPPAQVHRAGDVIRVLRAL